MKDEEEDVLWMMDDGRGKIEEGRLKRDEG